MLDNRFFYSKVNNKVIECPEPNSLCFMLFSIKLDEKLDHAGTSAV